MELHDVGIDERKKPSSHPKKLDFPDSASRALTQELTALVAR